MKGIINYKWKWVTEGYLSLFAGKWRIGWIIQEDDRWYFGDNLYTLNNPYDSRLYLKHAKRELLKLFGIRTMARGNSVDEIRSHKPVDEGSIPSPATLY